MEQPNQNIGTRKDLVLHRIKNAESDLMQENIRQQITGLTMLFFMR